jgi:hypothetical protein
MKILRFRITSTAVSAVPAARRERSAEKNFARFILRNPLISLDSDERIQGNPSESNSQEMGSSRAKWPRPRKPKRAKGRSEEPRLATGDAEGSLKAPPPDGFSTSGSPPIAALNSARPRRSRAAGRARSLQLGRRSDRYSPRSRIPRGGRRCGCREWARCAAP